MFKRWVSYMQTIVFIETNKSGSSRDAIKAAEKMGYFTVLFTSRKKTIEQRKEYPDVHEMYYDELTNLDRLRSSIDKLVNAGKRVKAIVSFVDSYVYLASLLSEEYCNSKIPAKAVDIMENKVKTRLTLNDNRYNPQYVIFHKTESLDELIAQQKQYLPVIVKSPSSTGSKDVFLVSTINELEKRIKQLQMMCPNEQILIEEYLEGTQYLIEALVYDNEVMIGAIIEQEITKKQRFIVTGYSVLADVSTEQLNELKNIITSLITDLGFTNGSLHVEIRHTNKGEWKVIEVNPRMSGGAMNQMLNAAFGINYVEETLKIWLGIKPSLNRTKNKYTFTKYLTLAASGILEKVTGKKKATNCPGVVDVYVKPRRGSRLSLPYSMGNRYAYVIAAANTKEKAFEYANNAAKQIQFHLANENR
jgi:biotin carboxylase